MIKKQINKSYSTANGQHKQHLSSARVFLLSGESVSFFILLYLVISNGGANEALHLWIPFVMLGIALFITSRVIH